MGLCNISNGVDQVHLESAIEGCADSELQVAPPSLAIDCGPPSDKTPRYSHLLLLILESNFVVIDKEFVENSTAKTL